MALTIADRVRETTVTTGTGTIALGGAVSNFETFTANLSNSDTTYYAIVDNTNGAFEVGLGTFTSSGTTLARTTIIASSNSNSAVNLGSGTKDVFITIPASKMVIKDASGNVSIDGDVTVSDGTNDFDVASHDGTNGLKLGGTVVTSSAAELNILDGKSFVDEDNMASDSATGIPSQQSVKAYVDSQVTAQDLDVASDSGTIDIDLDSESFTIAGGEGIDTSATGTTVTIAGEDATTSNKGVASFSSTFFSVSSGAVSLASAQTGITSLLATDIKIGEDDETKIDFETADEIHFYASNAEQVYVADGILGPETDSDVDLGTTGVRFKDAYVDSVTVTDNVTIGGTLTVNGTTTTINSTTTTVDDPIFTLGGDTAPGSDDNKDRGIEFRWHNGSAAKIGFFGYDDSATAFTVIPDATNSSEVFSGTVGNAVFGETTVSKIILPDVTSGKILVGDGTSYEEVAMSGDVGIASTGATTIQADAVEASMLNDNVISSQTELASGLASTDELLVSDAGTIKRMDMSVVTAFMTSEGFSKDDPTALAIALG